MTQEYSAESAPPAQRADSPPRQGTAEMVRDQAAGLSQSTVQAGKHAADAAREQGSEMAAEAARQGRDLVRQAQDQLGDQAARGQQRLAATLHSLSNQLSGMADGSPQDGVAADLARQAAARADDAAHWLSSRQPAQVVDEVQSFARRKPGAFLALAAGAGLIAGRLTRGMRAASSDDQEPAAPAASATAREAGSWARDPAEAAHQGDLP
jgi:polyhydroxyalkanoate synthesis regulator phasin